jgi:hypothetical protein
MAPIGESLTGIDTPKIDGLITIRSSVNSTTPPASPSEASPRVLGGRPMFTFSTFSTSRASSTSANSPARTPSPLHRLNE